ncbi:MAG: tetratricopeptide repeat protein [Rhodothermales bacterium]|nr:tetratricopeptide repeat protein [Rhodothermales bacterium]
MRIVAVTLTLLAVSAISASAQNAWSLTTEAAAQYSAGNSAEAASLLKRSLRFDSTLIDTYLLLGQVYLYADSLDLADSILKSALRRERSEPRVYHLLGAIAFQQGRYRNSIQHFQQVLGLEDSPTARQSLSMAHLNRGVELFQNGRSQSSLRHFESALEADPSNLQAHRNAVVVLLKLGRREAAEREATEALRKSRGDKELLGMLVELRQQQKDFPGALVAAQELYKYHPNDIDVGLHLAYLYRFNNRGDESFGVYESLLRLAPRERRIYDDLADLHAVRSQYLEAIDVYERLAVLAPQDVSVRQAIAGLYVELGDHAAARKEYRLTLGHGHSDIEVYHRIAETYLEEDRLEEAADTFREAIDRFPSDRSLYVALGSVCEDLDASRSVEVYEQMIEGRPSDPHPHVRLGVMYAGEDSTRIRSERHLRTAIELGSKDPAPHHALAISVAQRGDTTRAILYEREAITRALQHVLRFRNRLVGELGGGRQIPTRTQLTNIEASADSLGASEKVLRESLDSFLHLGSTDQREADLQELADTFPDATILVEYQGRLLEQGGWIDEAEATYMRLLQAEPGNNYAQFALARIWEKAGSTQKALRAYQRALVLDDENQDVYYRLIELCELDGRLDKLADEWLIQARRTPGNHVLLRNLARLLEEEDRTSDLEYVRALIDNLEQAE